MKVYVYDKQKQMTQLVILDSSKISGYNETDFLRKMPFVRYVYGTI